MVRTQVQLTDEQMRILREQAARMGVSIAELVRQAVDGWVAAHARISPDERRRRAMAAAGQFRSGLRDVSMHHDDYLVESFAER